MSRKTSILLAILMLGSSAVLMGNACDDAVPDVVEDFCGPCGEISKGDITISGNAELDGIFKAVGTLDTTTGKIKGNFDARVRALAEGVFDIDVTGKSTADLVAEIKDEYKFQIADKLEGGLVVEYDPPQCSANASVAVEAQAQCEAKIDASCSVDIECEPGQLSFECSGKCEGSCEGTCEVPTCTVDVEPGTFACSGECRGSCAVEVDAVCEGKCEGQCDGECSGYIENAQGEMECAGTCSGTCTGKCEANVEASCQGECRGECVLTGPDVDVNCEGDLKCEGKCEGSCSGGCEGEIKAPKCEGQAECDADVSAKCEAQASAQASASLECTPPSLNIDYNFKAELTAEARIELVAKIEKFQAEMVGILQGMVELRALVDADYAASLGIEAPTVTIGAAIEAFASALVSGEIEVEAPGLVLCAGPAFDEAGRIVGSLYGNMQLTIQGQLDLAALLKL